MCILGFSLSNVSVGKVSIKNGDGNVLYLNIGTLTNEEIIEFENEKIDPTERRDSHQLYGHTIQKLGCNLTLANYGKLTEFLMNTSKSDADWVFYNQWINDTQQVVTYKDRTDTVENIYMSNQNLQLTIQGYEDSYVRYNQMSEYEQWQFIQTKSITDDTLINAFETASSSQVMKMLTDSQNELDQLTNDASNTASITDDPGTYLVKMTKNLNNYNNKIIYAYESFNPDKDPVLPDGTTNSDNLQNLINTRTSFSDGADILIMVATGLTGCGILMIIGGMFAILSGKMDLVMGLVIADAALSLTGVIVFGIGCGLRNKVNDLSDLIHKLFPDYALLSK
jgi:hypothetical protein